MSDNEKLARWQGWQPHPNGKWHRGEFNIWKAGRGLPDYPTDSAACVSLLDTLVGKDHWFILQNDSEGGFALEVGGFLTLGKSVFVASQPTINQAIITACLEVIEREVCRGT